MAYTDRKYHALLFIACFLNVPNSVKTFVTSAVQFLFALLAASLLFLIVIISKRSHTLLFGFVFSIAIAIGVLPLLEPDLLALLTGEPRDGFIPFVAFVEYEPCLIAFPILIALSRLFKRSFAAIIGTSAFSIILLTIHFWIYLTI